jgi:asparagine synthase (glutamine-hydrolysing)
MCGFVGQLLLGEEARPDQEVVRRMASRIVHRGPDEEGFHADPRIALGFRRLAIIDLATGQQPMLSADGRIAVVFNGEIYNHAELRRELEGLGHVFRTRCDTEVLVHGYRQWGARLPEHLIGMFAFAAWNGSERTALLARDRMGQKPLYWLEHAGSLWFASELKALLEVPGWSRQVDPDALDIYLAQQFVPAPFTIYSAVRKLPPAQVLEVRAGRHETRPYWRLEFEPKRTATLDELSEELRALCRTTVRDRLESEVPLGAFLSGGVDSSVVVGLMSEAFSEPVKTYTIGFEEDEFDERPFAREVARHFGTEHHEFVVRPEVQVDLDRILAQYDEPFADKSAVPAWYVAREARRETTVVLTGDGADDVFAGYGRYDVGRLGRWMARRSPGTRLRFEQGLLDEATGLRPVGPLRHRLQRIARRHWMPVLRSLLIPDFFESAYRARLYRPEYLERVRNGGMRALARELHEHSRNLPELIDRMLDVDLRQYLAGDLLPKVDISSMAHSIEARSPFLDHRLVEFALRLPDRARVVNGRCKALLKHAFQDFLPPGITERRKKGFSVPVERWLKGELAPLVRELLVEAPRGVTERFRPEEIRRLFDEHVSGRRRHGFRLWNLLCFELWYRRAEGERAGPR